MPELEIYNRLIVFQAPKKKPTCAVKPLACVQNTLDTRPSRPRRRQYAMTSSDAERAPVVDLGVKPQVTPTTQSVQVKIELGHKASMRKKLTTEGFTHDWTVFIRGPEGSNIQHFVEKCVFHLHESFPKPKRVVKEPPYQITESGYGSFNLPVEIYFKAKEEPRKIRFEYDLFLHMHDSPPVNHVRCEKLTFQNPTEDFRRKLIKAGGVGILGGGDGSSVTMAAPGSSPSSQPPKAAESKTFVELFGAPLQTDSQSKHSDTSHSKKHKSHSKDKVRDKDHSKSKSGKGSQHQLTPPSQPAQKDSSPLSQDKSVKSASKRTSEDTPIMDLTAPPKKKKKDKDRERSKSSSGKPSSSSRERHDKHKSSKSSESAGKSSSSTGKPQEKEREHSKEKHHHKESSESSRSKSHKKSHKEKQHDKPSKPEPPKTSTTPPKEVKSSPKSKTEHSHSGYKRPKSTSVPPAAITQKPVPSDSSNEGSNIDPCEDSDLSPDVLSASQAGAKVSDIAESRSKDYLQSLLNEQSDSDEDMDVDVGTPPRAPQLFTPPTASPQTQPKASPHKLSPPKLVLPKVTVSPSKVVLSKMSPPKGLPPKVSPTRHSTMDTSEVQTQNNSQLSVTAAVASPKHDERHRKHSSSPQKHTSSDKSHSSHSADSSKRHKSHSSPSSASSPANLTSQRSRPDKTKPRESSSRHGQDSRESAKHSPVVSKCKEQEREFNREVETKSSSTPKGTAISKRKEPEVIKEKELTWGGSPQTTLVAKRREPEPTGEREFTPTFYSNSPNTVLSKSNKISPPLDPPDLLKSTQHSDLFGFQKENQGDHLLTNGSTPGSKPALDMDAMETTQLNPGCAPNGETFELLLGLQQKLNTMKDDGILAEVVRILDDSGEVFSMTDSTLDFDLCYLNSDTVHRLKHCFKLA